MVDMYCLHDEESSSGVWSKMYIIGPVSLDSPLWLSQAFRNGGEILIYNITYLKLFFLKFYFFELIYVTYIFTFKKLKNINYEYVVKKPKFMCKKSK